LNRISASLSGASAGVRLPRGGAADRSKLDRGFAGQVRRGVFGRCTTRPENTHGTEFRELLYRWHPWFGLQVCIHEEIEKAGCVVFRCTLTGSDAGRCLEVPAWMFDRTACARVRTAADAHSDLAALTALAALLRHALIDRFASSNALLSGAPRLSHGQNRGDVDATSEEADDRAWLVGDRGDL
jgi:hypothetical protein